MRTIVADGLPYHEAGGSDADELGANTRHCRRLFTGADRPSVEKAAAQLDFRLAATADQFGTIAKVRALRLLWARVGEVAGFSVPARIHAVTSWSMLTRRDPWVNMLRARSHVCRQRRRCRCDHVLPFDSAIVGRTLSPGGSPAIPPLCCGRGPAWREWPTGRRVRYIEAHTDSLAQRAWAFFQDIERNGGMAPL